jgi:hypothetical protein
MQRDFGGELVDLHARGQWLKDRIGRTLGYKEHAEYQRIIWALLETRRSMTESTPASNSTATGR